MNRLVIQNTADNIEALIFPLCLKTLRRQMGCSQREVSAYLGMSDSHYSRFERGEADMPSSALARLCRLFCISADTLLGLGSDMTALHRRPRRTIGPQEGSHASEAEDALRSATERHKARMHASANTASTSQKQ